MKSYSAAVLLAAQLSTAQQVGTLKTPNLHLPMQIQSCTAPGTCANEAAGVTLDGNWRWLHGHGARHAPENAIGSMVFSFGYLANLRLRRV